MEDWGQDITKGAYYSSKYMNDHISELGNQCSALLTELSFKLGAGHIVRSHSGPVGPVPRFLFIKASLTLVEQP